MKPPVVVKARNNRWHFGPAELEETLRADRHGVYRCAADASSAATLATIEDQAATSLKERQ